MAPLVGDGEAGFSYDKAEAERFELPGLWLNSEELHALLAAQQLLSKSSGGMLSSALAPLQQRVEKLLDAHSGGKTWPVERVRVIPHRLRQMDEHAFRIVASSVLERRKLAFDYRARSTDEKTRRNVSPQRLTHYRDNWYLDAWDEVKPVSYTPLAVYKRQTAFNGNVVRLVWSCSNGSYQIGSGSKYVATRWRCSGGGWCGPWPCAARRNFCSVSEYSCCLLYT